VELWQTSPCPRRFHPDARASRLTFGEDDREKPIDCFAGVFVSMGLSPSDGNRNRTAAYAATATVGSPSHDDSIAARLMRIIALCGQATWRRRRVEEYRYGCDSGLHAGELRGGRLKNFGGGIC
jgi:hypothetical protein